MTIVALTGVTGFVGTSVRQALTGRGAVVRPLRSTRLVSPLRTSQELIMAASAHPALREVELGLAGVDVLVNAAGDPDASSLDEDALVGANALWPAFLGLAAARAGVRRMVHISSAVVQNDIERLDESEDMRPFSAYSRSKVLGEQVVRELAGGAVEVVRYRPPSVHAPGRRVTRRIAKIAASPVAAVARPGNQGTPQALLPNVADAVAFLATSQKPVPAVVAHPSEGVTVTSLMRDLSGGRSPRRVPLTLARTTVESAKLVGRAHRPTAANARRLELLWLGQAQAESWLTSAGWRPVVGPEGWTELGLAAREESTL